MTLTPVVQAGAGPVKIVNPTRFSSSAIWLLTADCLIIIAQRPGKDSVLPIRHRQLDGRGRLKSPRTLLRRSPTASERTEHSYGSARRIGSTCGQLILRCKQLTIRIQYISKGDRPGPICIL